MSLSSGLYIMHRAFQHHTRSRVAGLPSVILARVSRRVEEQVDDPGAGHDLIHGLCCHMPSPDSQKSRRFCRFAPPGTPPPRRPVGPPCGATALPRPVQPSHCPLRRSILRNIQPETSSWPSSARHDAAGVSSALRHMHRRTGSGWHVMARSLATYPLSRISATRCIVVPGHSLCRPTQPGQSGE